MSPALAVRPEGDPVTAPRPAPDPVPGPIPRAPQIFVFRGNYRQRATGFVRPEALTCPDGHRVKEPALIRSDGALWCSHRPAAKEGTCGAILYVLVFPALGHQRRRFWAADITKSELDQLEALGLDPDGVLAYFGAQFTR
jgi:hypothetical protein